MKRFLKRFVWQPLLLLLFAALGILLNLFGFGQIENLRQIERIPRTDIASLIEAEANIAGRARPRAGNTIRAPKSGQPTLYYTYTIETRETDSDGARQWNVTHSETRYVAFEMYDQTGSIIINPPRPEDATVTLQRRYRRREGNQRFTENRIDAGMNLFAMGIPVRENDSLTLHFDLPGTYRPVLSTRSEEHERGTVGLYSILLTVGGLLCLIFSTYFFTRVVGIHQTLAYINLVAIVIISALAYQSVHMIENDIQAAFERLEREQIARSQVIHETLEQAGLAWDGTMQQLETWLGQPPPALTEAHQETIRLQRVNLARSTQRALRISSGFPERLIASRMGFAQPDPIPLTPPENAIFEQLEQTFHPSKLSQRNGAIMSGIGLFGALVFGGIGIRKIKQKRWIEKIPTVKTRGVVYGMNEIKGEVLLPPETPPLTSPLTQKPCVCYNYIVEERRGSGDDESWVTITDDKKRCTFLCRDTEGEIPVHPQQAELVCRNKTTRRKRALRYHEECMPIGAKAYILGTALIDPARHDRLYIARGEDTSLPFIVSDYRDSDLISRKAASGFRFLNFGFAFFMLLSFSLVGLHGGFGAGGYTAAALSPIIYIAFFMTGILFNDMVFLRRRCEVMWSNIDVALKKRFDLVPRLVSVAKAYIEHEQTLQQQLAHLRTTTATLTPDEATSKINDASCAITRFRGLVEEHPDLKSAEITTDLMQRISDLEKDVALMREGYNSAVQLYNTRIQRIPECFLAALFRFKPRTPFLLTD